MYSLQANCSIKVQCLKKIDTRKKLTCDVQEVCGVARMLPADCAPRTLRMSQDWLLMCNVQHNAHSAGFNARLCDSIHSNAINTTTARRAVASSDFAVIFATI